ncbi:hypothetical protein DXC51_19335 [Eisenbergiella massiliensis]|uniref:Uncharacterized protein n=1 Tax=Eisenbergiella massiliensis TaxID=1720294 RepID=A0A3E3I035_9FIRM|nr:hypothetical protein DXC51_19335 [Eisenbergiella massiliensis]
MPAGGHRGVATGQRWQEPKRGVNSNTSAQTCLKASPENLHITFFYIIMYADSCIRYRLRRRLPVREGGCPKAGWFSFIRTTRFHFRQQYRSDGGAITAGGRFYFYRGDYVS